MKRAVIVVAALVSMGAMAQTERPRQEQPKPKRQEVIFTPSDINGDVKLPTIQDVFGGVRHHFDSMIRVRANFNPELQKSVDSL